MTIYFSSSKNGFFSSDIHSGIPLDAIEISEDLHKKLLEDQSKGYVIKVGQDGVPESMEPQDPPVKELIERCKKIADRLLTATDWAVMPDVDLKNKEAFVKYRQKIRDLRINPVANPEWPQPPKPVWSK